MMHSAAVASSLAASSARLSDPHDTGRGRVAIVRAPADTIGGDLAEVGYDIVPFDCARAALDSLSGGAAGAPDVVLVDCAKPDVDACAFLRDARSRGVGAPIILLSDGADAAAEERALEHGAVDVVDRSRSIPILARRVDIVLKGAKAAPAECGGPDGAAPDAPGEAAVGPEMVVGELRLENCRAYWKGRQVPLTLTEFRMVELMASQPGADVSYRALYDLVHGQGFMAGHGAQGFRGNVRAFLKRIRHKFRAVDAGFEGIRNYPGHGYHWAPPAADGAAGTAE